MASQGLAGIGRMSRARRVGRKRPGSTTTTSPSNQKTMTATKGVVDATGRGPASATQANLEHQNTQTGTNRPPTLQQSQQISAETQASATATDSTDYSGQIDSITAGMGKAGPLNFAQKKAQNAFMEQVKKAKEGGINRQELEQLNTNLSGQQFKKFEKGAQSFQQNTGGALNKLLTDTAPPGASGGQGNPFMEGTVAEEYRPRIDAIEQQGLTQADQQAASEQAQKDFAQGVDTSVQDTQQRTGENIEGFQAEATAQHGALTAERQAMSEDLQAMPDRIAGKYDAALQDFTQRVEASQGIIDTKEAAALSNIQKGQAMAMTAAVQGTQGQVNSQVAQIQANPNLTDSQKAQMTAQVKLAGASSMGPQVGQTILGFNQLSAQTATAFGQMTTQIQDTGLKGSEDLLAKGAAAFENSSIAAKQIGAQLVATQANMDNNYITAQSTMEATRAQIDMTGDTLRASLIPEMGIPYPDYANVMATTLKMDVDLMNRDFQNTMGRDMMAFQMSMSAAQGKGSFFQTIAQIFSGIGGPIGQIGMGASMLLGNAAMSNVQPPPSMTGGYSQAGQPATGSFF